MLKNEVYRNILEGIVEVLCISKDYEELKSYLVTFLVPWIEQLSLAKKKVEEQGELTGEEVEILIDLFELIKIIVRSAYSTLSHENIVIMTQIFNELWPLITFFFKKFNNQDLVESMTQVIKHFMRGMNEDFKKYLEEYMNLILEGYKIVPISSYIYSVEIIASVFANDSSMKEILKMLLKEICQITCNNYLTTFADFENNPQLTEDFFGLIYRMLRLNPFIILDSDILESLFVLSINTITVSHIDSAKNISHFIEKIITFYNHNKIKNLDNQQLTIYYDKVRALVKNYGECLVMAIINYTLTSPPQILFDLIKEILKQLMQNFTEETTIWFQKAIQPVPHDCLTNKEKEKFIKLISAYNDDQMDDMLQNFYKRCIRRELRQSNKN